MIFDQRAELSKQKRHIAPSWDKSVGNKLLGFNEKGGRNLWGKVIGSTPGLNTLTHAIAKKTSSGSTQDVLENTFDEAVNKDFAGLALGVSLAKTIGTGGLGGGMGGVGGVGGAVGAEAGGIGGGLKSMFGGGKNVASGADFMGAAKDAAGATEMQDNGGGFMNMFKGLANKGQKDNPESQDGIGGMFDKFNGQVNKVQSEKLKNPFEAGSPEYMKFEQEMKNKQKENNKGAFGEGVKGLIGSATGGNIFESGANYAGALVASNRASKDEIKDASSGKFAYDPTFNYL